MNNLEEIFSQNPKSPIFTILASTYYNRRAYKNAAKVCQIGLKYAPNNLAGQYILAKLLLLKNEVLIAEKILKKIILAEPQNLKALLLLIVIMEKLNKSFTIISPYIKKAAQLYPSNAAIQKYYKKYCINKPINITKTQKITSNKTKQKINQRSNFILNTQLATKTLYKLFYSQKKYIDAYNVLTVMRGEGKNKNFVSQEIKKIKKKLS